jgi:two-component system alkaline phosphatase synthesis response regulator PhoP
MKRVMVVDDEVLLAEVIGEFLRDEGYGVLLAHGRQKMLHLLETEEPDLIFLDVMMPDGDGRDIVKALQSHPRLRNIPVVLMSAGVSEQSLNVQPASFLPKPFNLEGLMALVREIVGPATEPRISTSS